MTFNVHPIIPAFTVFHKNPKSYQLVQDGLSIHSRETCPTGRCPHGSTPTARGRLEFPSTAGGMYAENGAHLLTALHRCAWINPKKNWLNMLKLIPFLTMFILSERSCPKWYCLLYCFPTSMKKSNDQGIDESACLRLSGLGYPGLCGLQNTTEWNTKAFESLDVAPFPMVCHATLLFPSCWRSWRPSLNMTISMAVSIVEYPWISPLHSHGIPSFDHDTWVTPRH